MLNHKNIMFFCDECLEVAKEKLETRKEDMVAKEVQAMAVVTSIKDRQTEDIKDEETQAMNPRQDLKDKGIQAEEKDQRQRRGPTMKRMIQRMSLTCIVGDSMVRNAGSHLKTKMTGSSQECLRGAKIHEIRKTVTKKTQKFKNGLLLNQGSGNDLERIRAEKQ
ncbi:uncharacterized protein LOC135104668 [Scylla paramamosain]|uniref:uncharacterized protein LOC135104668 n=1 Tax=Scylla paramamosain TaxID=85552 RepID=UPI003083778F